MNNLFGIGILLELKDRVSERLHRVSSAMEDVQSEAERTARSVNDLDQSMSQNSGFSLTSRESERLSSLLNGTGREAERFQNRMHRMSQMMGEEMSESTRQAYATMTMLRQEMNSTRRQFGSYSAEAMDARNRMTEFALSLDDNTFKQIYMRSQLGLNTAQLHQQANGIKLNARMTKLMGSQTEILIRRMKGLQEAGVKPEMMVPPSTIGQFQLLNETIQASGSKIYGLSSGYRMLGGRIEKVLKNFSAQKVAIRMANGDMARYGLLLRGIQGGLMNLAIAFPLVGMAAFGMYNKIFSVAISTDKKLQKLIETVKGKLVKAFEPMLSIVRSITRAFFEFVGKVADLIIKFNEAHPLCAKIIQGFALLLPALTLLLLPLAMIPIGLNAFGVALGSLWKLIGPFVVGIGTASSMALGLVAVISALTLVFANLWKSNEKFRNAIINTGKVIQEFGIKVFDKFKSIVKDLSKAFEEGGLVGLVNKMGELMQSLIANISTNLPKFIEKGSEIVVKILQGIATYLPQAYEKGSQILQKVLEGIVSVLPTIIESAIIVLEAWLNSVVTNLSLVLNAGMKIVMALVEGIITILPELINTAIVIVQTLANMIVSNLPLILDTGIKILNTIIEGIINNLPIIVEAVTTLLNSLVTFVAENLPILIDAGIQILTTLANAVVENLPLLIDCGIQILNTVINAIITNLPLLISAGIQLVGSLVNAILNNLPQILSAGVQLVLAVVNGIVNSLPQILSAGGRIISTLFSALMRGLGQLISAGLQLVVSVAQGIASGVGRVISSIGQVLSATVKSAKSFGSQFLSIGRDLIKGLAQGIANGIGSVVGAVGKVVKAGVNKAKSFLGIKSPSRVFKQIGAWTSEGMAIGIDTKAPMVTHSIEELGENAVDQASTLVKQDLVLDTKPRTVDFLNYIPQTHSKAKDTEPQTTVTNNFTIQMEVKDSTNPKQLVDDIMTELQRKTQLRNILVYR